MLLQEGENGAHHCLSSLLVLLQVLLEQQQHPGGGESALPLPMDHVRCTLSTEERRILYDYVVEVGV